MKRCNKCGEEKVLNKSYFYTDKSKKDGFTARCKPCIKQSRENPKHKAKKGFKICRGCNKELPASTEYYHRAGRVKGTQYYQPDCKMCKNSSRWVGISSDKEGYQTCSDCLESKPLNTNYYFRDNGTKNGFYTICKQCKGEKSQLYHKENAGYLREEAKKRYYKSYYYGNGRKLTTLRVNKRKAILASLPDTLTSEEYKQTLEYFNHSCAYCECELTQDNHHMEHVYPISRGVYGTTKENCIPSCDSCNLSKGPKTLAEWYVWTEHYSFERLLKIHEITSSGKEWVINQKEHTNK